METIKSKSDHNEDLKRKILKLETDLFYCNKLRLELANPERDVLTDRLFEACKNKGIENDKLKIENSLLSERLERLSLQRL